MSCSLRWAQPFLPILTSVIKTRELLLKGLECIYVALLNVPVVGFQSGPVYHKQLGAYEVGGSYEWVP